MLKIAVSILIFMVCYITTYGQRDEHKVITTDSLRFSDELRSRKIPIAIGDFFEIPANCLKDPTTFIRSYRFIFPDASLGRIDTCSLTYELQSDTIRRAILYLPNALSVKQGGKQASKQFGKPMYTKDGSKFVYAWKHTTVDNQKLSIKLEVSADIQSGMMYVNALD